LLKRQRTKRAFAQLDRALANVEDSTLIYELKDFIDIQNAIRERIEEISEFGLKVRQLFPRRRTPLQSRTKARRARRGSRSAKK